MFGHATGDKLLIEVAHRVQAAARGAVVALLSGDEVGLIIDGKAALSGHRAGRTAFGGDRQGIAYRRQIGANRPHHRHLGLSAQWRGRGIIASQCRCGPVPRQGEVAPRFPEMGEWILRKACREAASWPRPLQSAVNLSPAQFVQGDVVSLVHAILIGQYAALVGRGNPNVMEPMRKTG